MMNQKVQQDNFKLYQIWMKSQDIYHQYALHYHLTPTDLLILYAIFNVSHLCTQHDLASMLYLPKQTINSAIQQLIKKEYIELRHLEGTKNSKSIHFTSQGELLVRQVIQPLIEAECMAMSKMSQQEREQLILLSQMQNQLLESCIGKLLKGENDE